MRLESNANDSEKFRWINLVNDRGDILINLQCTEDSGVQWNVTIEGPSYMRAFNFIYYGEWNEKEIFAEFSDQVSTYNRAKLTVFDRIFE